MKEFLSTYYAEVGPYAYQLELLFSSDEWNEFLKSWLYQKLVDFEIQMGTRENQADQKIEKKNDER